MSSTVFITNVEPTKNYSEATTFGAIRAITSGNYTIMQTSRLIREVAEALAYSTPNDFLLISGSATIAGMCLYMWMEKHRLCRMLLWDQRTYTLRVVTRETVRREIEEALDRIQTRKDSA